ncbi:hypothetical protein RR46_03316 [Papilio xuthus]|uniref:Uncharacterized protein n=1 Tax=Papilio xuthus TaxID=66420 RepID=A0A194Q331_PAPXU|nr:hypothetical protein RR46_03316 [Papilio xuthus]
MTTCSQKPDVIDINFHYVLSFGLSPNAGLERSFFNMNTTYLRDWKNGALSDNSKKVFDPGLVEALKYFGFVRVNKKTVKWFLYTAIATTVLAFMYGIFYVFVCVSIGTGFPILEFLFTLIDLVETPVFGHPISIVLGIITDVFVPVHNTFNGAIREDHVYK